MFILLLLEQLDGPLEYQGPLGTYFDKGFGDYHCGEDSFEKAERKMLREHWISV